MLTNEKIPADVQILDDDQISAEANASEGSGELRVHN